MDTAISNLTVLPLSKDERKDFVAKVAREVDGGLIDPIKLAVYLKSIEETVKSLKSHYQIKDAIQDEADKYPEKNFHAFGAEITKTGRTTYDYLRCDDEVWDDLMRQLNDLKALIKARETTLKTGVDPSTGETFKPPLAKKTEFLKIDLK